jgi:DNA-3-methyladenine glycosylase I
MYAHMQATGLVNDHVLGCFRHKPCVALAKKV